MKNFENWWKEESNKADGCDSRDKHYRWRERDVWAKDAWKAALDWILKQEYDYNNNWEIFDVIRWELKEDE